MPPHLLRTAKIVALLLPPVLCAPADAGEAISIVNVSASHLKLYSDGDANAKIVERVPRTEVPLPLAVLDQAKNLRMRVEFDANGRHYTGWVDKLNVDTRGDTVAARVCPKGAPSRPASPRGIGDAC